MIKNAECAFCENSIAATMMVQGTSVCRAHGKELVPLVFSMSGDGQTLFGNKADKHLNRVSGLRSIKYEY